MPKKKPADQPDPDVEAQANEETTEAGNPVGIGRFRPETAETVRQRPQQPYCTKCGELMTARASHPTKTYYKCPKCGLTANVPRPSPVPSEPPECPYHPKEKVQCKRSGKNGIVIDRCPRPGCGFRHDYGPAMPQTEPQEGFSAR